MIFKKPDRYINRVFVHCSASDNSSLIGDKLVSTIDNWHRHRKPMPFDEIGYHFVIDKQGTILPGRNIEKKPAAQERHNLATIAICVHGLKNFTAASLFALKEFCNQINLAYEGKISFHGHKEVNPYKTCPVYDYKNILNLNEDGIMKTNFERKHHA